jgi:MoaA/NifB/PqqE/SkfB family radical SAM enzyme
MFQAPVVDLYVTGACNLGCRYCYGELDSRGGMPREVLLSALKFARHLNARAVEFCGGEPLLYKDFDWSVEEASEQGFELILRTNALRLAERRSFVAKHFKSVGISLDGDIKSNDLMRPLKSKDALTPEEKFSLPLSEINALKHLNPGIHVLLASVATKANLEGLVSLARILVEKKIPIDVWKVYQFLANNFRARDNESEFSLDPSIFSKLSEQLRDVITGAFPLMCRKSEETDRSCVVVNVQGDVLLGSEKMGNVLLDSQESIAVYLEKSGVQNGVARNKNSTYKIGNSKEKH